MRILLDTNIILRMANKSDPQHRETTDIVRRLYGEGHVIFVFPQCIYEMWAVMTRPTGTSNGLNFTPAEAALEVGKILQLLPLLPDTADIFPQWLSLVTRHGVSGRPTHDARLAAAIQIHGLDAILTRNTDDFKRFGLNVIHPDDLSSGDSTP